MKMVINSMFLILVLLMVYGDMLCTTAEARGRFYQQIYHHQLQLGGRRLLIRDQQTETGADNSNKEIEGESNELAALPNIVVTAAEEFEDQLDDVDGTMTEYTRSSIEDSERKRAALEASERKRAAIEEHEKRGRAVEDYHMSILAAAVQAAREKQEAEDKTTKEAKELADIETKIAADKETMGRTEAANTEEKEAVDEETRGRTEEDGCVSCVGCRSCANCMSCGCVLCR